MEPIISTPTPTRGVPGTGAGRPPEGGKKEPVSGVVLHTMRTDIAHAIKEQNESLVSIAIAEEKKLAEERAKKAAAQEVAETARAAAPAAPRRGRLFIVIGLFLGLGALALGTYFIIPKLSSFSVPSIPFFLPSFGIPPGEETGAPSIPVMRQLAPSLLRAQSEKRIEAVGEANDIFSRIYAERAEPLDRGAIKNIYLFERETTENGIGEERGLSAPQFLALTGVRVAEPLARALEEDTMIGLWGGEEPVPFIVLTVSRYETALAGMFDEERELPGLFDAVFGASVAGSVLGGPVFRDIVVEGRDARIAEVAGRTIAYAFADEKTIIMVNSKEALTALVRIATGE